MELFDCLFGDDGLFDGLFDELFDGLLDWLFGDDELFDVLFDELLDWLFGEGELYGTPYFLFPDLISSNNFLNSSGLSVYSSGIQKPIFNNLSLVL